MYKSVKAFLSLFFKIFFRVEISGIHNIPLQGGVIIAANHLSLWDPPVLGTVVPREIHFMAKEELFHIPLLGRIITSLNAFPVRRGAADRTAIRTAIELLEQGNVLGIFPEGTRSKLNKLGEPQPGVAMIALKSGATIIPTAIVGTNCNKLFQRWHIQFGEPIKISKGKADKESIENLSIAMMKGIEKLLPQSQSGIKP